MGLDWDSILAYNTIKVVRIRDRRLGLLHLAFMICIIFYVIIYSAFLKKGYLTTEVPIGSIRTSLTTPTEYKDTQDLPYCLNSTLPYKFQKLSCEYWDSFLGVFPIGDDVAFTTSTRVKIENQKSYCHLKSSKCRFNTTSTEEIYLADIESFTILIDHTLFSSSVQYNAHELSGYILDQNGNEIQLNETGNTIGIAGKQDVLQIKTLLEFGGIDLDSPSLTNSSNSIRYDGVVALVFITYSNTYTYSTSNFKYVYSIKLVEDTSYDIKEAIILDATDSRLLYRRHGIRLLFVQDGEIGSFNFQSLLLTLVSGLGLLTVATLIVDQLAIRFLPQRKSYSSLKFQVTDKIKLKKKKLVNDKGEELLYDNIESL